MIPFDWEAAIGGSGPYMRGAGAALGAVLVLVTVAGCSSVTDRGDAAAAVAVRMLTAAAERDAAAACALLGPDTLGELEQFADKPCAEAILAENLPQPGRVSASEVYGQRAQVRLSGDTVFLAVFPGGWRVVAAGCTARGEKPYDCVLQGG
ncbi:hypothetical protein ONO23_00994 [Micromonospora noduli]|uniref:Uncharacterized protein n=2 Tax=Micromonospora noduli TaxID=709876 RepID=A0A328NC56_9ACTN|nr:hypothetical protein LAH08_01967 [Micromonospora noduli]RAO07311.1 hypothetical protein LUPAC07_06255 [Micromonospora noduli]RAO38243.1 hypothetical protein ONO23_00994 [Micromonospora noduli]